MARRRARVSGMPGQRLLRAPRRRLGLARGPGGSAPTRRPDTPRRSARSTPGRPRSTGPAASSACDRPPGRRLGGPRVAHQRVPARLGRVEHRLRARGDPPTRPLLRRPRQLRDLPRVSELRGEVAHGRGEHIAAVPAVARRLGEPQRLDVVPLGQARLAGVDGHVPGEFGQSGDRGEQFTPHRLPVRAREQPGDHAVEVVHDDRAHMPAAVLVVQLARAPASSPAPPPRRTAPPAAPPRAPTCESGEEISQSRLGSTSAEAATDEPDRKSRRPTSLRHSSQTCSMAPSTVGENWSPTPEARFLPLAMPISSIVTVRPSLRPSASAMIAGRPAARLLSAQPAGHGRLVVAQVETVLGAAHVDPAGEPGVRAARFLDERLQPFVRLPRDERPCGHGVPPVATVPAHAPS